MNRSTRFRFHPALLLMPLVGGVLLGSCAPSPSSTSVENVDQQMAASGESTMSMPAAQPMSKEAANAQDAAATGGAVEVPRSQPQLIKTAELGITVESVAKGIDTATAIARQQQGDVLGLQDQIPADETNRHTASLQIRVPQVKLEATLNALSKLGTVQHQAITADDVSTQLVDYQARLKNLRRTEEMLLKIMERSGSVGDVLKVSQELSNVRSSIEQIDAQLQDLKNRVAYSSITLNLEEAIATNPPQRAVPAQLEETWDSATHSLGKFTVDLMQIGIWLMVYSPYWLLIAAVIFGYLQFRRHQTNT